VTTIPKVTVCLATYNGGDFLHEQIESLISQKNIEVRIIAGDDGSEDNTVEILEKYFKSGLISKILYFDRIGSTKNFASLLQECSNSDYVAFADQDDIWDEEKLSFLTSEFSGVEPQLVFCGRVVLNAHSDFSAMLPTSGMRIGFQNALIESSVPGNTIVLNSHAVDLINDSLISQVKYFDAYIYLLISALGRVVYVEKPLVHYRIHSKNQVGLGNKSVPEKFESIANYIRTAEIFKSDFGNRIPEAKRQILSEFLNAFHNPNFFYSSFLILKSRVQRQKRSESMGWKMLAIILKLKQKYYSTSTIERK
jgi:glycosyltransferase involved in cell wall biosynthesis